MNSTVVSSSLSQGFVAVKCENNHNFKVNYTRNYAKTWCEECKNQAVQQQKDTYKQREESEEQRKRAEQKRLFEESQQYMQQQQQKEAQVFRIQEEADYYNAVMSQV